MRITSWGQYPLIDAEWNYVTRSHKKTIARGMGRSYGDSALYSHVTSSRFLNLFLDFDSEAGYLRLGAGVTLGEILELSIPKGWFLPVTPGTQYVTVGGAIASDVHGKNHHRQGCFSEYVESFLLCLGNGEVVNCSRNQYPDLFKATCGGMGLTGIILEVTIKLQSIQSTFIDQIILKTKSLEETLELFETHTNSTYSVAWIDCLNQGRSRLILGEHAKGEIKLQNHSSLSIPFNFPVLNSLSIKMFNEMYYRAKKLNQEVYYQQFFYPLDKIKNWNRLYGKKGFTQYQFVIPKAVGLEGLKTILNKLRVANRNSFLAVLKMFGKQNENYLSFPIEGYTLALDFKLDKYLFDFLNELDSIVLHFGGRLYLTKDCRMSEKVFKQSYPQWQVFQSTREKYYALDKFESLQSRRIGL